MSKDQGEENERKLAAYLKSLRESGGKIPECRGRSDKTAVSEACGVPRNQLYKNLRCRAMLEAAIAEQGLPGIEPHAERDPRVSTLERRIGDLERKNSDQYAQIQELRRQILKYKHIEEMLAHGRRVIP
jgi:predicted RNase H-like nuclease (RuvC/YqgF family)